MNVPLKHREVAHAWVDGAEVETLAGGEWCDMSSPQWVVGCEYRVKPKKIKKWRWVTSWCDELRVTDGHYADEWEYKSKAGNARLVQKIDSTEVEE